MDKTPIELEGTPDAPPPQYQPKANVINRKDTNTRLTFTLRGVLPSYANAIRRAVLSNIPVVGFITSPYDKNRSTFVKNTSRFNNEFIKHRLSCLPIHHTKIPVPDQDQDDGKKSVFLDTAMLVDEYAVEIKVSNKTDSLLWITTEDFYVVRRKTGELIPKKQSDAMRDAMFPPFTSMGGSTHYIDLLCLRPYISDAMPGEEIHFRCEFSVCTADESSCYNVASLVSYGNTVDLDKQLKKMHDLEEHYKTAGEMSHKEIKNALKNFELLEGKRIFVPNSFDFIVESLGIYSNEELIKQACFIISDKLTELQDALMINTDTNNPNNNNPNNPSNPNNNKKVQIINRSDETTIPHCWDVVMSNEFYSIGVMLNDLIVREHYGDAKANMVHYCGFKKLHPHDSTCVLRLGMREDIDGEEHVQGIVWGACAPIREEFLKIGKAF